MRLLEAAYKLAPAERKPAYRQTNYDGHVERALEAIIPLLPETSVPKRGFAVRLLEGDKDFESKVDEGTLTFVRRLRDEIQQAHNEDITVTIARGRHSTADLIANAVLVKKVHKPTFAEKFGDIATRPQTGYPLLFLLVGGMLALIFYVGGYLSALITTFFEDIVFPPIYGILDAQVVNVFITSAIKSTLLAVAAATAIAIPYILLFFIFLAILEDVGYLPRVATLLDRQAHVLGLHGRSLIPLLFGYGWQRACNYGNEGSPHEEGADYHHHTHHHDTVLSSIGDNSRRRGDICRNPIRTLNLPHLRCSYRRVWETAQVDCAGKDSRAGA